MLGSGRRRISKIHYSASNCRTTLNFAFIESSWTRLSFETKFMKISWLRELEINFKTNAVRCCCRVVRRRKLEKCRRLSALGTDIHYEQIYEQSADEACQIVIWVRQETKIPSPFRLICITDSSTRLHARPHPIHPQIIRFEWNSAKLDGILVSFGKLKHPAECGIQSGAGGIEWSVKTGGRCWVPSIQRSEVGVPLMALVTWCCSRSERFQTCPAGVVNRRPFGCCDIK